MEKCRRALDRRPTKTTRVEDASSLFSWVVTSHFLSPKLRHLDGKLDSQSIFGLVFIDLLKFGLLQCLFFVNCGTGNFPKANLQAFDCPNGTPVQISCLENVSLANLYCFVLFSVFLTCYFGSAVAIATSLALSTCAVDEMSFQLTNFQPVAHLRDICKVVFHIVTKQKKTLHFGRPKNMNYVVATLNIYILDS